MNKTEIPKTPPELRALRARERIPLRLLADNYGRGGCSVAFVSQVLNGGRGCTEKTLAKVRRAFRIVLNRRSEPDEYDER